MDLKTEFDFVLPLGYRNGNGALQRIGQMRLALAIDEIESLKDPRVQANEAYLPVILLSRVVTRLGDIVHVTPQVIECLYAADLAYLSRCSQRNRKRRRGRGAQP